MTVKPVKLREHSTASGQLFTGIFSFHAKNLNLMFPPGHDHQPDQACVFPPLTTTRKTNCSYQGNYDANLLFSKAETHYLTSTPIKV